MQTLARPFQLLPGGAEPRLSVHDTTTDARADRVTLLLVVVVLLSYFDFAYTNVQLTRGNFIECNALARTAMEFGVAGAAAYKTLLTAVGLVILYRLRSYWQAEAGAWVLVIFLAGLMIWWHAYLAAVEIVLGDPAGLSPVLRY
jgi:hypothetical protein